MGIRKIGEKYNEKVILKEGETCEGNYVDSHTAVFDGDDLTFYTFQRPDGTMFDVLETSVLGTKMREVKKGEYVIITYSGDRPSKKRKGKSFKNYVVEVDDDKFLKEAVKA
jgi:hypothetical protein